MPFCSSFHNVFVVKGRTEREGERVESERAQTDQAASSALNIEELLV